MKSARSTKHTDVTEEQEEGTGAEGELTHRQERAPRALLTYPTLKEAAHAAGVSEETLWRYRRDGEFARRLKEAGREADALAAPPGCRAPRARRRGCSAT